VRPFSKRTVSRTSERMIEKSFHCGRGSLDPTPRGRTGEALSVRSSSPLSGGGGEGARRFSWGGKRVKGSNQKKRLTGKTAAGEEDQLISIWNGGACARTQTLLKQGTRAPFFEKKGGVRKSAVSPSERSLSRRKRGQSNSENGATFNQRIG